MEQLTESAENFTFGHVRGRRSTTESAEFGINSFSRLLQNAFRQLTADSCSTLRPLKVFRR
jgi:hypothetical protein